MSIFKIFRPSTPDPLSDQPKITTAVRYECVSILSHLAVARASFGSLPSHSHMVAMFRALLVLGLAGLLQANFGTLILNFVRITDYAFTPSSTFLLHPEFEIADKAECGLACTNGTYPTCWAFNVKSITENLFTCALWKTDTCYFPNELKATANTDYYYLVVSMTSRYIFKLIVGW